MAVALELFGNDFVKKQGGDLSTRMRMARNTFSMMGSRAHDMGKTMSLRFEKQYEDMKNRTWIKRLLLGRKYR